MTSRRQKGITCLRLSAALLCLIATGAVATVGLGSGDDARAQTPPDPDKAAVQRAEALTQTPALFAATRDHTLQPPASPSSADSTAEYDASTVEAAAKRISSTIPFPPGLNSATHRNWPLVIDRGLGGTTIPDYELQRIVQANALRDWAWFATNRPLSDAQRAVIATTADWSAFRGQAGGTPRLAQKAMDLGPTAEGRAFSAQLFPESGGTPQPSSW